MQPTDPARVRASIYMRGSSGGEEEDEAAAIMGWTASMARERVEGVDMHASHAVYVSVGGSVDILSFLSIYIFQKSKLG